MHGLILACGEGSRLAADGVQTPKAFVDIAGVPQLLRLVEQFHALGCPSITCMLHESACDWLRTAVDDRIRRAARRIEALARVVPCRTPSSLHTFVDALTHVQPGWVFAAMVDSVMSPNDWASVFASSSRWLARGADAVLAVTPARDHDDAPLWVALEHAQRVIAIGPDAAPAAEHVTGGVYAFAEAARARAAETLASGGHRMRIFLRGLVASGLDVRAVAIPRIIDIDHRDDLDRANTYMKLFHSADAVGELP